jgi:hypothetical protein
MGIQATGWVAQRAGFLLGVIEQLGLRGVVYNPARYRRLQALYNKGIPTPRPHVIEKQPLPRGLPEREWEELIKACPGLTTEQYEGLV